MRHRVYASDTIIVKGPATVVPLSGCVSVLGASLNSKLIVSADKQIPIEAISESELGISLRKSGQVIKIDYTSIPKSWTEAVDTLTLLEEGTAIIIGPTDVGKSTLCTYLMNGLLNRAIRPVVIDADIGQTDVGPPTTIASTLPTTPIPSLTELIPDRMVFIGHTNPSAVESRVICGIKRLMDCYDRRVTIINTDGWTLDSDAVRYKSMMISKIKPEIVIGIGSKNELQPIMNGTQADWISIEPSRAVLQRSRTARRELRNCGYRKFLEGSTVHTISLNHLNTRPSIPHFRSSDLDNLIIGLLNERGFVLHIGVLIKLDAGSLRVFARSIQGVKSIELGYVKISINGSELDYFE
ncbi:MAG TPA: Clp1/GlmU family protein [Candidatus Bathyarchaeia archaeon]|nr:Clp1/GlmU family protein [Candidatus Bathyarchaeia archaeon]